MTYRRRRPAAGMTYRRRRPAAGMTYRTAPPAPLREGVPACSTAPPSPPPRGGLQLEERNTSRALDRHRRNERLQGRSRPAGRLVIHAGSPLLEGARGSCTLSPRRLTRSEERRV